MSFQELQSMFDKSPTRMVGCGVTDLEIADAERRLGVRIKGGFCDFLRIYGWGGIASVELYGLGCDVPLHLDLVLITESERSEMSPRLPAHLLPIMNDGGGNMFCLDTRVDEPPVVLWNHEAGEDQDPSIEGSNFCEWFINFMRSVQ